jgi:hypothetical protein
MRKAKRPPSRSSKGTSWGSFFHSMVLIVMMVLMRIVLLLKVLKR